MMQGVEGNAMLKSKAYLDVLAAAAIIVVSVAPAFAQTRLGRSSGEMSRPGSRDRHSRNGRRRHRGEATRRDPAAMPRKRRQTVSRQASFGWRPHELDQQSSSHRAT